MGKLADGVEFLGASAVQSDHGKDAIQSVEVAYTIGEGWKVTLTADLKSDTETDVARLVFEPSEGASPVDGINSGLLRMIPFRHAKAEIQREILKAWSESEMPTEIPQVCETPVDYALLAMAYEWFAATFPEQPLKKMQEQSGINKTTLATRVNKAKALGFLSRESSTAPYKLTDNGYEVARG